MFEELQRKMHYFENLESPVPHCRSVEYVDPEMKTTYEKHWSIRVTFIVGEFKNCPCPIADKVFSFIDPCAIKQIPLKMMT